MEHNIKEEGILEFKALTMSRGFFKQLTTMDQKAYMEYVGPAAVDGARAIDPWDPTSWIGYTVEETGDWFIFQKDGTLKRIRDIELWWVMRSEKHPQPTQELQKILRQVFLK